MIDLACCVPDWFTAWEEWGQIGSFLLSRCDYGSATLGDYMKMFPLSTLPHAAFVGVHIPRVILKQGKTIHTCKV